MENSYAKGSIYAIFMGRAFNDHSRMNAGMHGSTFQNLVDSEKGESHVRHLGPSSKLLSDVKMYMHKAMDKYLGNRMLSPASKAEIEALKNQIDKSGSSAELYEIIDRTIDLTQVLKG